MIDKKILWITIAILAAIIVIGLIIILNNKTGETEKMTLLQVKEIATPELMDIPGVVGVGVSEVRQTIIVYVKTITNEVLSLVPKEIRDYKVEIMEIGEVELLKW